MRTQVQTTNMVAFVSTVLRRQREMDTKVWLTKQPSLLGEIQASERHCLKIQGGS